MIIRRGLYRRVLVFNTYVLKLPRNLKGWLTNINEIYRFYRYKKYNHLLCPILFHDIFGFFIVMPRVLIYTETDIDEDVIQENFIQYPDINVLYDDSHIENFGIYKGSLVKIDYGVSYWIYNTIIDIKNKVKLG